MKNTLFILLILLIGSYIVADDGYKVGDNATDFKLKNIDGNMVSLVDYKDAKGFIVVFTCNHCPFSVMYEDRIIELDNKYKEQGYMVVAINPNDPKQYPTDSYEHMQERAKEKGFTFPYLFDDTQDIAKAYGATRTPHIFILKKKKDEYIVEYIGAIDDRARNASLVEEKFVENAVDALLKKKKVEKTFTKAIGCSIKWRK